MATSTQSSTPVKKGKITVYFLAAPEDEDQTKAVKKYLSPVVRNSEIPIEILSDFEIPPGQDINEYKPQLYDADIVLAFISADFINDDQTYIRTQKVIEKYNNDENVLLPILVRNCMWKSTPFVNLPLLPKNTQPLNNKQFWNSEDDAFTSVVNDIYESINEFSYNNVETVEDEIVAEASKADISELLSEMEITEPTKDTTTASSKADSETEVPDSTEALAEQVEDVVETEQTKAPIIEKVAKSETVKPRTRKKIANVDMQVDWRKKYYRRVLWKRALAFILDQILTTLPLFLIGSIIGGVGWSAFTSEEVIMDETAELTMNDWLFFIIIPMLLYFVVSAVVESSRYKGTFGKMIMKMEITDRQGNRIGFFRAFFRNILRFITGYLYVLIIPFIIQIFTYRKYKKLFHDQITYTVVGERLKQEKHVN
ncbi:RDD family protein [Hwangdonia lutea]|uniref:RDD family protein n=1 Tax=Hwangdonia lutea TaxID=3075823 RepID=A0AA97HPN9_9FLAO|nr:RDD family protein [Hwangdonia sp. SCSIO 19198]WOD42060.1 RDD family protein [Hwangdonia sp. SCSIO 19198]